MGKYMSSNYGRLSIIANYRLKVMSSFLVSNNCFSKPKVTSQVIHFKPREDKIKIKNLNNLEKVTNIIFQIKEN